MSEIKPEDMAEFKCHKVVRAAKVVDLVMLPNGNAGLILADGDLLELDPAFVVRHFGEAPYQLPGYVVRYEDGYLSWSPVKAFEEGYTKRLP